MQVSTVRNTVVSVTTALLVAAAGVVGVAAASGSTGSDPVGEVPTMEAPAYEGDPWEKRFRDQFWADQHIHDSWNRCHLGENVPRKLQQGPGC